MIPGWVFVVLGIALIGVGTFLTIYGQWLLPQQVAQQPSGPTVVLTPQQERLLGILYDHQKQFGVQKLIVGRDGAVVFDEPERKEVSINVAAELFGGMESARARAAEFVALMDSMPEVYLRRLPETRYDSPFVVAVTEAGIRHLKSR